MIFSISSFVNFPFKTITLAVFTSTFSSAPTNPIHFDAESALWSYCPGKNSTANTISSGDIGKLSSYKLSTVFSANIVYKDFL